MYLHLGQSTVITTKDLIGIFDMDVTTVMKSSRDYLSKAEKNGENFLVYCNKLMVGLSSAWLLPRLAEYW